MPQRNLADGDGGMKGEWVLLPNSQSSISSLNDQVHIARTTTITTTSPSTQASPVVIQVSSTSRSSPVVGDAAKSRRRKFHTFSECLDVFTDRVIIVLHCHKANLARYVPNNALLFLTGCEQCPRDGSVLGTAPGNKLKELGRASVNSVVESDVDGNRGRLPLSHGKETAATTVDLKAVTLAMYRTTPIARHYYCSHTYQADARFVYIPLGPRWEILKLPLTDIPKASARYPSAQHNAEEQK